MKDSLVTKLRDIVVDGWGEKQWEAILDGAGFHGLPSTLYMALTELDEAGRRRIVECAMSALSSLWMDSYGAPVASRSPVEMSYEWRSADRVVVRYESHAPLVDLLIALLETMGGRLHAEATFRRTGHNRIDVDMAA